MGPFARDDAWQRQMRDKILVPAFYGEYAVEGRYVFVDKGRCATILQQRFAVDTIVQEAGGYAACIEEKIVRWPQFGGRPKARGHNAFCLETDSCTRNGWEASGWMKYGQADYLLYCFANSEEDELRCFLIDFLKLKEWFWEKYKDYGIWTSNQVNQTRCRIVPIEDVKKSVGVIWSDVLCAA